MIQVNDYTVIITASELKIMMVCYIDMHAAERVNSACVLNCAIELHVIQLYMYIGWYEIYIIYIYFCAWDMYSDLQICRHY